MQTESEVAQTPRKREVANKSGSTRKADRVVRVLVAALVAVVPSVLFLSDPPLWWNRAHLVWNKVIPGDTPVPSTAPLPRGVVVVPLTALDGTTAIVAIDVESRENFEQLTPGDTGPGAPSISADRRTIYYPDASGIVHSIDSEGGGSRIVFRPDGSCMNVRHVSVSAADTTHILLQCRDRPTAHQTDYHDFFEIIDFKGTVQRIIRTNSSKVDDPTLSPDGNYLAYWGSAETAIEGYPGGAIYVLDLVGGGEPRQLSLPGSARDRDPSWTADSSSIAFTRKGDGSKDIYVVRRTGGNPRLLIQNAEKPSWSIDGESLVAVRKRSDDTVELISFDRRGHHVKALTGPERTIQTPVWSSR